MTQSGRTEPVWIESAVALAIHDRQLSEHGGGAGVRDLGMLESVLARPVDRWTDGEDDPCALAAANAFGIVRNHPFVDGNKRTGWVLARLFLALNAVQISFDAADAIRQMLSFAAGDLSEEELADWLRTHIRQA
jgi:death-on-curing protein